MRTKVIQGLSVLLLILGVIWFISEPGYEPVITAIAALVGLFSVEFLKSDSSGKQRKIGEKPETRNLEETEGLPEKKSIVVLPFDNMSPDPGDAYFADGLTEEIITDLSYLRSPRVISRSSAMVLKGTQKDLRTIGEELNVQYVLEGSVRKAGRDLRITAQLIDAASDAHVWAEKYDGVLDDVFAIQERVSQSIVQALRVKLSPAEADELTDRPIPDLGAYELFLRGREGVRSYELEDLEAAERDLHGALRIVPENPLIIIQLAHLHYNFWNLGFRLDENDLRLARTYAEEALDLNPNSPDHLVVRGLLEVTGGNAVKSLAFFEAAIEHEPRHRDALYWSTAVLGILGREADAKKRLDRLREVDPLHSFGWLFPALIDIRVGRFASALEIARKNREAHPSEPYHEGFYALALALNDRPREGALIIREAFDGRHDLVSRVYRALGLAFENDREGVIKLFDSDFRIWAEKDGQYAEWMAQALALVGEVEEALDWLEISVERGNINYPSLREFDHFLDNLRDHPRFEALMERVKPEWEGLEARSFPLPPAPQ